MGSRPTGCLRLTPSLTSADPALQRRNTPADSLLIKVTVGGQEAAGVRAAVWRGSGAEQSFPSLSGNPVGWVQTRATRPAREVGIRGPRETVRWSICSRATVLLF